VKKTSVPWAVFGQHDRYGDFDLFFTKGNVRLLTGAMAGA
jgi:hypothetical protein